MSDHPTSEKNEVEQQREELLKTYIKGEQAKIAELQKKKNPSVKQRFFHDLRSFVEKF